MSPTELQNKVIDNIRKIEDTDLLTEVNRLLEIEASDDEIYKLSHEEVIAVTEAQNQIKNGEFLADEDAKKDIREWLKK